MANFEINSNYGYELITEKISFLTDQIDNMLELGDIKKDAAEYLLKQFGDIAKICTDSRDLSAEEKNTHSSIHF